MRQALERFESDPCRFFEGIPDYREQRRMTPCVAFVGHVWQVDSLFRSDNFGAGVCSSQRTVVVEQVIVDRLV